MKIGENGWILFVGILFVVVSAWPEAPQFVDIYRMFVKNELPTNQEIKESFFNLQTTPLQRKELAFSLLIPKNWRDIPLKVSPEVLEHDTENIVPVALQLAPEKEKGNARKDAQNLPIGKWSMDISLAARTMSNFAHAVVKENFSRFYADLTPLFQVQTTPQKLLQSFATRTDLSLWVFIVSGLAVLVVSLLTVSLQPIKVATANPVNSTRYE